MGAAPLCLPDHVRAVCHAPRKTENKGEKKKGEKKGEKLKIRVTRRENLPLADPEKLKGGFHFN